MVVAGTTVVVVVRLVVAVVVTAVVVVISTLGAVVGSVVVTVVVTLVDVVVSIPPSPLAHPAIRSSAATKTNIKILFILILLKQFFQEFKLVRKRHDYKCQRYRKPADYKEHYGFVDKLPVRKKVECHNHKHMRTIYEG